MRASPPLKAVIVALPTGAWLRQADAGLVRPLALIAGAAFLTFAWIMFTPPRAAVKAPPPEPAAVGHGSGHSAAQQRISRTPTGRCARDVRCRASRGLARRPTRR